MDRDLFVQLTAFMAHM